MNSLTLTHGITIFLISGVQCILIGISLKLYCAKLNARSKCVFKSIFFLMPFTFIRRAADPDPTAKKKPDLIFNKTTESATLDNLIMFSDSKYKGKIT